MQTKNTINMMKTLSFAIYILSLIIWGGCSDKPDISPILSEAERLMKERPDSSLFLLEEMKLPEKTSDEQYALWCLLLTQAQDKEYIEHTSDSLITVAVRYFDKKDNLLRKAQAYYCQGRVFTDMLLFEKAIICYLKADEFVSQITDFNLQARIYNQLGDLYRKNSLPDESLAYYQKANGSYRMEDNQYGIAYTLRDIGLAYLNMGKLDSSLLCLNQSLEIIKKNEWKALERLVLICLGNVYESMSLFPDAISCIKESFKIEQRSDQLYSAYYLLGSVYDRSGQKDSACYYWEKALKSPDINIQNQIYRHFSLYAFKKKEYKNAFEYNEQYLLLCDSIERIYRPRELAEINARYNYERLINEKNRLELQKKEDEFNYLLIITSLLLLVFVSVCILYKKQKKIKENERFLLNYREQLLKSELDLNDYKLDLIQKEKELQLKEKEQEESFKKIQSLDVEKQEKSEEVTSLLEQVLILKNKISAKELSVRDMSRKLKSVASNYLMVSSPLMKKLFDKKIVVNRFSEKDWHHFDEQLNFVYPGFIRNLKKKSPDMSDNEFRFCCMYLLGVKTCVIANILNLQPNTISKYIKGIEEKYFNASPYDSLVENLNDLASKSIFLENSFWDEL